MLAEPQRAICRNSRRGIHSLITLHWPPALCAQADSCIRTGASTAAYHLRFQRHRPPEQSAPSVARNAGADSRVWPSLRYSCSILSLPRAVVEAIGTSTCGREKRKKQGTPRRQVHAGLRLGANRGLPSSMGTGLRQGKTQATDQFALDLRERSFVRRARVCPVASALTGARPSCSVRGSAH